MIRRRDADACGGSVYVCGFASPDYLDQAIQHELAALVAIAAVYRSACCWLDEWSGPEPVKGRLARDIKARQQTEREPHLLRLAKLHQQRAAVMIATTFC